MSDGRLWIVGGESSGQQPTADVQMVVPNPGFGRAGDPGAGSPFAGDKLLIADRGSDRLLLLERPRPSHLEIPVAAGGRRRTAASTSPTTPSSSATGRAIISNQEDNDTIVEIAYPSGRITFQYGHPRSPGTAPGYLNTPDDAYLLGNGQMSVADAGNCRVLIIDPRTKRVVHQIGTPGRCLHDPPAALGSPNGDTPLANGNLLVSEINGSWIDELTPSGRRVWAVHLADRLPLGPPAARPRPLPRRRLRAPGRDRRVQPARPDPVPLPADERPRRARPPVARRAASLRRLHGQRRLQRPDGRDRPGDPGSRLAVRRGRASRHAPGLLNTPDGFDLLAPGGTTPTHPTTG